MGLNLKITSHVLAKRLNEAKTRWLQPAICATIWAVAFFVLFFVLLSIFCVWFLHNSFPARLQPLQCNGLVSFAYCSFSLPFQLQNGSGSDAEKLFRHQLEFQSSVRHCRFGKRCTHIGPTHKHKRHAIPTSIPMHSGGKVCREVSSFTLRL